MEQVHREDIEWEVLYHFSALNEQLPRVLLIGDSICGAYSGLVNTALSGKFGVSFWASSRCLTNPFYRRALELVLAEHRFALIHFNNGLHSLETDRAIWARLYQETIDWVRAAQPGAKLSIANSTALRTDELNAKVAELNALTVAAADRNRLALDDLNAVVRDLPRADYWIDDFHFTDAGYRLLADAIVKHIDAQLPR